MMIDGKGRFFLGQHSNSYTWGVVVGLLRKRRGKIVDDDDDDDDDDSYGVSISGLMK